MFSVPKLLSGKRALTAYTALVPMVSVGFVIIFAKCTLSDLAPYSEYGLAYVLSDTPSIVSLIFLISVLSNFFFFPFK